MRETSGDGDPQAQRENRKAGVSGDEVAIRLPNNAKGTISASSIPLYDGICVQPYCGQHR